MISVPELKRLFDGVVEENRQLLRNKLHDRTRNAGVDSYGLMITMLADEIAYLKAEQAFERIYGEGYAIFTSPIGDDSSHLSNDDVASFQKGVRAAEVNFSGFFHGSGWHGLEWDSSNKNGFRWTDGDIGYVSLRIDRRTPMVLEFDVITSSPGNRPGDISLILDDAPLPTTMHSKEGETLMIYRSIINGSSEQSGKLHHVGIRCAQSSKPSDHNPTSSDYRLLGLAVSAFRIYPVTTEIVQLDGSLA